MDKLESEKSKQAVILIIVHKEKLTIEEEASLKQCYKILGNYKIVILSPEGLNINAYKDNIPVIEFDFIDPKWQSSYAMFNRLKILPFLYKRYQEYEYILFYELDAWVFKDDLAYWCDKGYDYIGAPWYDGYHNANEQSSFIGVGNGGFSLRNVKAHLKALNSFSYIQSPFKLMLNYEWKHLKHPRNLLEIIYNFTIKNNTYYLFNNFNYNEDTFWGSICNQNFKWFKVPGKEIASQFSMEMNAPKLFKQNESLPFGCHGWYKHGKDFWSKHIKF